MAIVYGRPDSEIEILRRSPKSVEKFEDISTEHQKLKDGLSEQKKDFFEKVPSRIIKEEQKLDKIKAEEKTTERKFDEKIKKLKEKKNEGGFSGFSASFKGYVVKNYSKKREINKIKELQKEQESQINAWKENPEGIFNKTQKETISEIKEFDEIKKDPFYAGAKGELNVLDKLSELNDDYHIFCDVSKELDHYVTYNGRRNLRSAQMDFVVVSYRGVVLIEAKNWSSSFYRQHDGLSPHEQVDRAGRVLWISLKSSWRSPRNPPVTSVLLSIRGNMRYDNYYKFVNVKDLKNINYFIQNRYEQFSDKEVERIIDRL